MDPCTVYATGLLLALMTNSSNLSLFPIFRVNRLRAAKRFWQMESGSSYNKVIVRAKEKVKLRAFMFSFSFMLWKLTRQSPHKVIRLIADRAN